MTHAARRLAALFGAAALAACNPPPDGGSKEFQGYAEGEYLLLAAPSAGTLERLSVARGVQVTRDAPLFALEHGAELAAKREADERLRAARARIDNLRAGLRKPQLDALQAETDQARAALRLSAAQLEREEKLEQKGFVAPARLDEARANLRRDEARIEQVQAQMRLARQSVGREPELAAAQAEAEAAAAVVAQAQWRLEQKTQRAPVAALVHDTFFVQGEWVPAGRAVLSLLPPANIKLRFFVPEGALGALRIGQKVSVRCDGCGAPIAATLSYVSPRAEFTPPILYSRDARAKLVFLVEARPAPADAARLKPGQPVDVTP